MEPIELGPEYELRPINVGYEWSETLMACLDDALKPSNLEGETISVQTSGGIIFTAGWNMMLVPKEGVILLSLSPSETERLRGQSSAVKWVLNISGQAYAHGMIPVRELLP